MVAQHQQRVSLVLPPGETLMRKLTKTTPKLNWVVVTAFGWFHEHRHMKAKYLLVLISGPVLSTGIYRPQSFRTLVYCEIMSGVL